MTSVEELLALYCSLKVACHYNFKKDMTLHCTVLKIACNSNSKKDKKRHDIALHCKMCHCA